MELGLVLTLCGLGVAFWLPAIIIGLISHGKKKNCTMNTIGLVIRINSRSSGDSGLNFYPVYEYYVNGIQYTNEGASIQHHVPTVGTRIPVIIRQSQSSLTFRDMIIRSIRFLRLYLELLGAYRLLYV
jgi:hypothetical protein